jgi:hypothetical protein
MPTAGVGMRRNNSQTVAQSWLQNGEIVERIPHYLEKFLHF